MTFNLKFDINDDWENNNEIILNIIERIQEKHPAEPIIVEVQFKEK
ncbi:MAG: hypothetical protein ACLUEZ_01935 [Oscillospiraceae bacterium]|jgi:hypothetical protein